MNIGDRVKIVKDIFADENDSGCVGMTGTVVGFNVRIEVLLDGNNIPVMGFDEDELELVK